MSSIKLIGLMATHLLLPHLSIGFPGGLETKITRPAKIIAPLYSWFVQIRLRPLSSSASKTCIGVLISKNEILIPAHCLFLDEKIISESSAEVWVTLFPHNPKQDDSMELEVTEGIRSVVHPGFVLQPHSMDDIAILLLKYPLPPHSAAPDIATSPSGSHHGSSIVLRYGHLERVTVSLWSFESCLNYHPVNWVTQICASDSLNSIRPGDSGSPLLCSTIDGLQQLCGIVSYGSEKVEDYPQAVVYTNLSAYRSWLNVTSGREHDFRTPARWDIIFVVFISFLLLFLIFACILLFLNKRRRVNAQHRESVNDSLLN